MSRNASGIAVVAVLLCLPLLAQAPANNSDAEREAARAAQGYTPVRLWELPDVRALRVELKPMANRAIHQHDDVKFHLFIPLEGKLQITIGSNAPVDAPIGQAFYIKGGTPHGFRNLGSTPGMAIEVFVKNGATSASLNALGPLVAALHDTVAPVKQVNNSGTFVVGAKTYARSMPSQTGKQQKGICTLQTKVVSSLCTSASQFCFERDGSDSLLIQSKRDLESALSVMIGTCNKCNERGELTLAGRVCGNCSDTLDAQWASVQATDWVLITIPGPNDKVHSTLLALKESLGPLCDGADRLAEPVRYIYRNTTYAEMKSLWVTADPPGERRLGSVTSVESAPLKSNKLARASVPQTPMLRPAIREEVAEHDQQLRCRQQSAVTMAILEKWGFNDEYSPVDGVWDRNAEDRAGQAYEETRQRLAGLGLLEGSGYEKSLDQFLLEDSARRER